MGVATMNLSRRDAIKLAIAGALSPLLSLLPEREKLPKWEFNVKAVYREPGWKNVWWEFYSDWQDRERGLQSYGSLRLWKEGVPGHVFIANDHRPDWVTPEMLAREWSRSDGRDDGRGYRFIRMWSLDRNQCYDFYCDPSMQDELERGSLYGEEWNQGPLPVQKEAGK